MTCYAWRFLVYVDWHVRTLQILLIDSVMFVVLGESSEPLVTHARVSWVAHWCLWYCDPRVLGGASLGMLDLTTGVFWTAIAFPIILPSFLIACSTSLSSFAILDGWYFSRLLWAR